MKLMIKIVVFAVMLGGLAGAPAAEQKETPSQWHYDAVLYGWLTGLEGTIGFGDDRQQPVDATFDDLLNILDFSIAGHFEAKNASAVVVADVFYAALGSTREGQVNNQTVDVDIDLNQWIIEVGGGYRVSPEFDVLVAGRYYILDFGATSTSIAGGKTGEAIQDWGDIYIGARYARLLREKWLVSIRGDIGTGGSKFAWFGDVNFGYRITDLLTALVGYRILSLDREPDSSGDYFKYDVVQNGWGIGLGFTF